MNIFTLLEWGQFDFWHTNMPGQLPLEFPQPQRCPQLLLYDYLYEMKQQLKLIDCLPNLRLAEKIGLSLFEQCKVMK